MKDVVCELVPLSKSFLLLNLISECDEAIKTCQILTVAIVLPSTVATGDFTVRVIEDGDVLEFTVTWLKMFVDIEPMNLKWLKCDASGKTVSIEINGHQPKILGFKRNYV